jgi:1-deoxy-D-xylulose-5-phosphate reductoisomerase
MKKVLVLGCTGSIGKSTLDIIRSMPQDFCVAGLYANKNKEAVNILSNEFQCKSALYSEDGIEGIQKLIDETNPDIVVNGIAGSSGLIPSKIVLDNKIDLALANKETVVMAYPLIKSLAEKNNCKILPVDSEHSAVFNLINQCKSSNIDELVITASGGPFRTWDKERLSTVTLKDALKHPTWNMGQKITVDSATLANKGLEVIEACRLFNVAPNKVKVVVHPESLIHSLVRTNDGMLYAQISEPDMKHPILSALSYPELLKNPMEKFSLAGHQMSFFEPRYDNFPLLSYAYEAAKKCGSYTIAFNAADEIAANAFIEGKIKFTDISRIVYSVLENDWCEEPSCFEDVFTADKKARIIAQREI